MVVKRRRKVTVVVEVSFSWYLIFLMWSTTDTLRADTVPGIPPGKNPNRVLNDIHELLTQLSHQTPPICFDVPNSKRVAHPVSGMLGKHCSTAYMYGTRQKSGDVSVPFCATAAETERLKNGK